MHISSFGWSAALGALEEALVQAHMPGLLGLPWQRRALTAVAGILANVGCVASLGWAAIDSRRL